MMIENKSLKCFWQYPNSPTSIVEFHYLDSGIACNVISRTIPQCI